MKDYLKRFKERIKKAAQKRDVEELTTIKEEVGKAKSDGNLTFNEYQEVADDIQMIMDQLGFVHNQYYTKRFTVSQEYASFFQNDVEQAEEDQERANDLIQQAKGSMNSVVTSMGEIQQQLEQVRITIDDALKIGENELTSNKVSSLEDIYASLSGARSELESLDRQLMGAQRQLEEE